MSGSRIFSFILLCSLLLCVRLRAQTLHVCKDQVEHSVCELVCITPDQTQTIAFYKLPDTGTEIAQCISFVGCFNNSPYNITQPNATATVLSFILTRSLIGSYRCNYGSLSSTESVHWGTYPSRSLVTGVTNGSEIESVDEFIVFLDCFYSEDDPTITLSYKDEQGNEDATSDLFSCTNSTTSSCPHDSDFTSYDCPCRLRHKSGIECTDIYDVNGYITISNVESLWDTNIVDDITFPCPTLTTEMSSTSTSQDQTTSSKNPSVDSFANTEKTETTNMTTTDSDLTSASLHVSSEVTPSIQTESDTGTGQDQITSSQKPSNAPFYNTLKTETTFMTTTNNDLASSSVHVSSEVTTPIKTKSDNITDLGVGAIIAIAIAGFIFLSLIIILFICCCQYYRKKSKKKTSEHGEAFQEIHDYVVPKFWPNFNSHRYGLNEINGSTIHLPRGYNIYQGEHNRVYNFRPKHQSDNYNRSGSDRKIITENRKHKQKQVQEKISHGFPQSIPDDIMNRHDHDDINGINTYNLHDNNQNMRTYYRGHDVSSPRRFEYQGSFLPHEYIKHNRRISPYMTYLQEHVPRNLEGLTFYQGYNGATNKRSRRYY